VFSPFLLKIMPHPLKPKYMTQEKDMVNNPAHYGGKDNTYEAIKVIEAWELGFSLGNCVKYVSRCEKKGNTLQDLEKAQWYLNRAVENYKRTGKLT
jgi:hypothetical protein